MQGGVQKQVKDHTDHTLPCCWLDVSAWPTVHTSAPVNAECDYNASATHAAPLSLRSAVLSASVDKTQSASPAGCPLGCSHQRPTPPHPGLPLPPTCGLPSTPPCSESLSEAWSLHSWPGARPVEPSEGARPTATRRGEMSSNLGQRGGREKGWKVCRRRGCGIGACGPGSGAD